MGHADKSDKLAPLIVEQAIKVETWAFIDVGIAGVNSGSDSRSRAERDWGNAELVPFHVKGTTFSGHPTKTTFGNSLRSILYFEFVLQGINLAPKLMAAGDDVVLWVP